jgi:dihydrofolate reductase
MRLSLIWAMARNRTIGRDNALPWSLPDEMRHFVRTTRGKPVIMGRKQFEAMGSVPLPRRTNIVLSRNSNFTANGVTVVRTLDEAVAEAKTALNSDDGEAMVIGGAEIYALALPRADRLYFTLIDADIDGDTFFPAFDAGEWREISREDHAADARHRYGYTIRVLDRIRR